MQPVAEASTIGRGVSPGGEDEGGVRIGQVVELTHRQRAEHPRREGRAVERRAGIGQRREQLAGGARFAPEHQLEGLELVQVGE